MKGQDLISAKELSREKIRAILDRAYEIKHSHPGPLLKGFLLASCFFEPSTRTRLSFEAAMKRLGGDVIGFSEQTSTSAQKGESLHDTMKVVGLYSDVVVIRHPQIGSAAEAALATETPVVNAGDGANEHPTQTLLDLFSIQECQGKLDGLKIAFVGDLLYGRTVHSLTTALKHFKATLYFVSSPSLAIPQKFTKDLDQEGISYSLHSSIEEIIDQVDILYMTRIQKERFANADDYALIKDRMILTSEILKRAKKNLKVLHPLPRVNEIALEVDQTPHAYYFQQAENGLYVRQALLALILGK